MAPAASRLVHLELRSVAGDLLEFDIPADTRLIDLKPKVTELWQIPPICQKWVVGSKPVDQDETFTRYVQGGLVCATLLVSMGSIMEGLNADQKDWHDVEALQMVSKLGDRAIPIVSSHLEDALWGIRRVSVQALGRLAPRGDAGALSAVRARLTDLDWSVRTAALEALVLLASPEDDSAIADAASRAKDVFWCVRVGALRALAQLAPRGHAGAIAAVCDRLYDEDSTVQRVALEVVGQLAPVGDQVLLELVVAQSKQEQWFMRRTAVIALTQFATGPTLEAHLCGRLEDADEGVRLAAVEGLAQLEQTGHKDWLTTIAALRGRLGDRDLQVRTAARELLCKLTKL